MNWLFSILALLVIAWLVAVNARLRRMLLHYKDLTRQARQEQEAVLSLIDKLGEKITSKIDLDETLRIIAEYLVQATHAQSGAIYLLNETDQALDPRVVLGPFPPLHEVAPEPGKPRPIHEGVRRDRLRIGEGIVGMVAEQGEPVLISDASADPRIPSQALALQPVHSMILCPLRVRGRVLGVFAVVNKLGGQVFDSRDMALLQALADQAAITVDLVKLYDVLAEQQRLEQELAVAHDFQKMLLPHTFPELDGIEIYAFNEAAMVVGGDFFDFFEIDRTHLGLVIADVSGKGIPGALIMAMVRAVLRAESRNTLSPKEVLRRVNERIVADTKENVFITMTYGILDLESHRLRFVRAGHEPLLIVGPEQRLVAQVSTDGLALGLVGGAMFEHNEEAEIQLKTGEVVVLYTDGVVEAMDQSSIEYGRERMVARLQACPDCSAQGLIRNVMEDIHQFTLGIPQHDDITLLAVRIIERTPAASRQLYPDRQRV